MRSFYIIALLAAVLISTGAFAEDKLSSQEESVLSECNLAARNSLVNADIRAVEDACTKAIKMMEKSYPDKDYMINPILNLAFTYSLGGYYDKAEPLLKKAKEIGRKVYKPGSSELKAIDDFIKDQRYRRDNPPEFSNSTVKSPH